MRISAIKSYQTNPHFNGEGSNKTNRLKNAAGAAAIALASVVPAEEADAQIFYPPIYPPTYITVPPLVTPNTLNLNPVPNCFIVGDNGNVDYNKSMREVFNELDTNENGAISANEVVRTERKIGTDTTYIIRLPLHKNNKQVQNLTPFRKLTMKKTQIQTL